MKDDDLPYVPEDAQFGRVSTFREVESKRTIICPEITFRNRTINRQTITDRQCLSRVIYQAKCVKTCPIGKKKLEEYKKGR